MSGEDSGLGLIVMENEKSPISIDQLCSQTRPNRVLLATRFAQRALPVAVWGAGRSTFDSLVGSVSDARRVAISDVCAGRQKRRILRYYAESYADAYSVVRRIQASSSGFIGDYEREFFSTSAQMAANSVCFAVRSASYAIALEGLPDKPRGSPIGEEAVEFLNCVDRMHNRVTDESGPLDFTIGELSPWTASPEARCWWVDVVQINKTPKQGSFVNC